MTTHTSRNFFLHLGVVATLYTSAFALLALLFVYIDFLFPDPAQVYYGDPFGGAIRSATAFLIVAFPLFVYLLRLIHNDLRAEVGAGESSLRKWLLYLTLFVAGMGLAIDLVVLIISFLDGSLILGFFLKIAAVAVVASAVFWYFTHDLRGYWNTHEKQSVQVAVIAVLIVVASAGYGFTLTGSPFAQRAFRLDEQRVNDLTTIQSQLTYYWQQKQELPASLGTLEDPLTGFRLPLDPITQEGYRYEVTGAYSFTLCATFERETPEYLKDTRIKDPYLMDSYWVHGSGEVCFDRTIDPEKFQPYERLMPLPAEAIR